MTDKRILIVANEVSESLDEPGLVVLDCRFDLGDPAAGRRSFLERHIAGARFIDLDDDLAGPVSARTGRHPLPDVDTIAAHVPGAVNLPFTEFLNEDGTWRSREDRARRMRDVLGDDPGVPWSVMCGSGVTACHLAIAGLEAGYGEPRLYVGSWSEWIRDPERPVGLGDAV